MLTGSASAQTGTTTEWKTWLTGNAVIAKSTLNLGGNVTFDGSTNTTKNLYDYKGTVTSLQLNGSIDDSTGKPYFIDANQKGRIIVADRALSKNLSLTIKNVTFKNASGGSNVGGVFNLDSSPNSYTISLSISEGTNAFEGNSADGGGAIYCSNGSSLSISGGTTTFEGNVAENRAGGAIYLGDDSSLSISGGTTTFRGNSSQRGGAIGCENLEDVSLQFSGSNTNVTFEGNTSGGINNDIDIDSENSLSTFSIQGSGTYYFGGGINTSTQDAEIYGDSETDKVSVTFGAGSDSFFSQLWLSNTDLTINLGTAASLDNIDELTNINPNINTKTPTSFQCTLDASGSNTITVDATNSTVLTARGTQETVIIGIVRGIDTDVITITGKTDLGLKAKFKGDGYIKNDLVVLSPLVVNSAESPTDYDISISEMYQYNDSTTQTMVLLGDLTETVTTTLPNTTGATPTSTLTLQSDGDTVRTVTGPASSAILQNTVTDSVTNLSLNNITLTPGTNGQAINAKTVNLSGTGTIGASTIDTLNITGEGTEITLNGTNTISGTTTISNGTLKITNMSTLGTVEVNDTNKATLKLGCETSIGTLNSTTPVSSGTSTEELAKIESDNKITITEAANFYGVIVAQDSSSNRKTVEFNTTSTVKLYSPNSENRSIGNFVLTSGNLDMKGYYTGSLELDGGTFSPGNSIGDIYVNGTTGITGSALMSFEIASDSSYDKLTTTTLDIDKNGFINLEILGTFDKTTEIPIITYTTLDASGYDNVSQWLNSAPANWSLTSHDSKIYAKYTKDDPEPTGTGVPEPSTWALLILGCAGLMWYRKRGRR